MKNRSSVSPNNVPLSFTQFLTKLASLSGALAVGLMCSHPAKVEAAAYASSLTNNAGTVSFILNESADSVKISCGATVVTVSNIAAGTFTTNIGVSGLTTVEVTKIAGAGYKTPVGTFAANIASAGKVQISTDPSLSRFATPRGVAVNKNPASPFFGRIYVANSTPGITGSVQRGRGLYTLNADFTDSPNAYGTNEQTGGITFTSNNAGSPYRIYAGKDSYIYIADYSDNSGGVYRVDGNLQNGETVLAGIGGPSTVPEGTNHGSIYKVVVEGTSTTGDLTIYTVDEDYGSNLNNDLWKYSVGSAALPYSDPPVNLSSALIGGFVINDDFCKGGTNGYIYLMQNRSSPASAPVLYILNSDGTQITDSRTLWRAFTGVTNASDVLTNLQSIAISPDGNYLAAITQSSGNSDTVIIPLTNGIPDFSRLMMLDTGTVTQGRGIDFDAAGNLYTISSGDAVLRAFSPGGTTTATTGTDGTFQITTPPTQVSVATVTTNINEGGGTNGVFTFTRSGDVSGTLTVNYTISGTASNGTDYVTLSGTVTFAAGASTTNVFVTPINDSAAEATETVTVAIGASPNYGIGTPATATISILDNESPVINITVTQAKLLEVYSFGKSTFQLRRLGDLSPSVTVNLGYTGTATRGTDYNSPASVTFASGAVSTNFNITAIDDTSYEGNESVIVSVGTGSGYTVGTTNSATATLIDDDLAPGQPLFVDNFDTDTSANWTVNAADGLADTEAIFNYDYSQVGIPSAPHSSGGTTRGVRLRADIAFGGINGISISPTAQNFTGDYRLSCDMWINYNGPLAVGGAGSTQGGNAGIATSGTQPQWTSGNSDGIWFAWNSDGDVAEGITGIRDFNAYVPPGSPQLPATSGVYAAGTNTTSRDCVDAYYNMWGGATAPAAQVTAYPGPTAGANQTGTSRAGCLGMAWHTVVLTKLGTNVTWAIDGVTVATVDITPYIDLGGGSPSGYVLYNNISLGYDDAFSGKSDNTEMSFQLFDNVRVEAIAAAAPVISSIQLIGNNVQIDFTGSATDTTASFAVVSAAALSTSSASYTTEGSAVITSLGSGSFRATLPASTATRFYRIRR